MTNPFLNITKRFPLTEPPNANAPIFILSTIWRSGSTALQRVLVSDPDIQVWGEPYSNTNLIPMLAQSSMALATPNWLDERHFINHEVIRSNPENYFIANWYPPLQAMFESHRAMLDRLFKQPAEEMGKQKFGIKFVRIGILEMHYLQWIYPDAKFIILVRNPWDCWRSYKGYDWVYRWPKGVISTPKQFAKLWEKQTSELMSHPETNQVKVLRYEDFIHPDFNWSRLRAFCDLPNIRQEVLENRIMGVNVKPQPITEEDCAVISKVCGNLAQRLGYLGLKNTQTDIGLGDWRNAET